MQGRNNTAKYEIFNVGKLPAKDVVISHVESDEIRAFGELSKAFDSIEAGKSEKFEVVIMPNADAAREQQDAAASVKYSYNVKDVTVTRTGSSSTHGKLNVNTLAEYAQSHSAFWLEHLVWYVLQSAHILAPLYFLSLRSPQLQAFTAKGTSPFSDLQALLKGLLWGVKRAANMQKL